MGFSNSVLGAVAVGALAAAASCSSAVAMTSSEIDNPTGDCEASSDGGRLGYHAPNGAPYLPHCEAPLGREYWRVFLSASQKAAIIPRPDALGIAYGICGGADQALETLFRQNGLCAETANLDVVNAMAPEDALAITYVLHQRLVFEVEDGDMDAHVVPYAFSDDIALACGSSTVDLSALTTVCEEHRAIVNGSDSPGLIPSLNGEEARQLAAALNELYGIETL